MWVDIYNSSEFGLIFQVVQLGADLVLGRIYTTFLSFLDIRVVSYTGIWDLYDR
jgi:hypothetical protein